MRRLGLMISEGEDMLQSLRRSSKVEFSSRSSGRYVGWVLFVGLPGTSGSVMGFG